jgi:hypothetical protein
MIIDEDAYLEHFGVKGMRWGVRNVRKAVGRGTTKFLDDADIPGRPNRRSNRISDEQKRRETRNARIAVALAVGYGAVRVGMAISQQKRATKGIVNASELRSKLKVNESAVNDILRKSGGMKASDLRPPSGKRPKISPEAQKFINEFSAKQSLLNKAANSDLKDLYEKGQVPLPLRDYLSDWEIEL